ncbi:Zinc-finger homeodomain protein 6 [Linum grandiflorum]
MEDGDTKETTSLHRHTAAHQQHSSSEVRSRRTDHHRSIDLTHDHHRPPLDLQTNDPDQDDRRSRFRPTEALPVQHHHRSTSSSPPPPTPLVIVRYKECMKNHAPLSGRHVVDGCGEFMPRYFDYDDGDMRCDACDCHRNFHRQEIDNIPPPPMQPPQRTTATTMHHGGPPPPVMMMNFSGVGGSSSMGAESSSEDLENLRPKTSYARKRYRTKFSKEQKEMMADLAERIGWRIQKQDESEVHMFCSQIGVKRKVFKVWMHNNRTRQSAKGKQM